MKIDPYLFFGGRCDEAIAFYRDAIGAEVDMLMRHNECPTPPPAGMLEAGFENKVMHAQIHVGQSIIMLSDGCSSSGTKFEGFSLSLTLPNEAAVDRAFAALSAGGQVRMPLAKTFWSPRFGMLTDHFGVGWMLTVPTHPL